MSDKFKQLEVTVRLLGNYNETSEIYCQRVNYDWAFSARPMLVQEIIAVVNGLYVNENTEKLLGDKL